MKARQPESIGEILARRLRQSGLEGPVRAAQICALANTESQGRYQAIRFRDGTLTLRAANSIVAHELRLAAGELAAKLKNRLGWPSEYKLRVRVIV